MNLGLFASDRTKEVITADAMVTLQQIAIKKAEIETTIASLKELQLNLEKKRKGRATYIQVRNIAGTLAIIAIAVGAYKTELPRLVNFTGLKLMLSSNLAVSGIGLGVIQLNQSEIEDLSRQVILSLIKLSKLEKGIDYQVKILCREDPRHQLCYKQ